ncbi:MAG: RsmB/NOP family class I SAM-dependent RNA methyltransferase [Alphaproteobacteria bacterium]
MNDTLAKETETAGLPARRAALAVLSSVLRKRVPLELAVEKTFAGARLARRDAAFARALATQTLRRFGQIDALLRHFMVKPVAPHRAGATMEILLAGACELTVMGVPPHAAVDGANRLAQTDSKALHFKPLINAVLRRVAAEGAKLMAAQDAPRLNTPDWLWTRWCGNYGEAPARAIAAAHAATPPLDLVWKNAPDEIPGAEKIAPNVLRLNDAGRIEDIAGYRAGAWWVQDVAASIPARLFGDVRGRAVFDLCAAPGGKTLQLAAMGAQVTAVDVSKERMARLRENLARTKLKAELAAADIRDWKPEGPAPFVLLDAPCTATGTIRRHPDLPWIRSAADLTASIGLQAELLEAAARLTAPGGVLVYAVCSLEPEEGLEQIESFLSRHSAFARLPLSSGDVFGDQALLTRAGDLRTLPSHWAGNGGMDGFFAARLTRI